MDPSVVQTEPRPAKPAGWWKLATLLAGAVGALGAVAAAGSGTYDVAPFRVELRATPSVYGKTELAVQPEGGFDELPRQHAEAGTHASPITARATIVGLSVAGLVTSDQRLLADPYELNRFFGREGKDAVRAFALKLAALALAGGLAGGLVVSMGRWKRMIGGALAGLLTFAVIGLLMQQTYDSNEFTKTRFVVEDAGGLPDGDGLPLDLPT
ncbi:MAG TPA: hypothetical protein VGB83_07870 [Actinomycetota bacterium]